MTWSTNKPTVEGWYWWRPRNSGMNVPHLLLIVVINGAVKYRRWLGDDAWSTECMLDGEWSGPLEPPVEGTE